MRSFLGGWADPNETVTLVAPSGPARSHQETYTTTAAADGTWGIQLNPPGIPYQKGGGAATISVIGSHGGDRVVATNVVFGDVILCAGGAAMAAPLGVNDAAASLLPRGIRVFTVGAAVAPISPTRPDVPANSTGWVSTDDTASMAAVSAVSALCVKSAAALLALYPKASGRKLGLVVAASEQDDDLSAWLPAATATTIATTCGHPDALATATAGPAVSTAAPTRFNAMIAPFALYSFRSILWALSPMLPGSAKTEACRLRAMINGWRDAMPVGDVAFHMVQSQSRDVAGETGLPACIPATLPSSSLPLC